MVVGSLALAGIPIFAGFFSKDEILAEAFNRGYYLFWAVGVVVAFMTAFYTFRMVYMTFHGTWRGPRRRLAATSTSRRRPWSCRSSSWPCRPSWSACCWASRRRAA